MTKRLRLSVLFGVAILAGVFASAALANVIGISGSMEGSIKVSPGDWVSAGYSFTIPGSHPAETVQFVDATVTLTGPCTNGGYGTVTVPLTSGPYTDPVNSSDWFPTGDQNSPTSLQGAVQAPSNLCGGAGQMDASSGAVFAADLQASDTSVKINVRFHYRDPNAKGKGNVDCYALTPAQWDSATCGASWSSTNSYTPDILLPLGTIGGLMLAGLLGATLIVRQIRSVRRAKAHQT